MSASAKSKLTSPGNPPNHSTTADPPPDISTVPVPLPAENGTTIEAVSTTEVVVVDAVVAAGTVAAVAAGAVTFGTVSPEPPSPSSDDEQAETTSTTAASTAATLTTARLSLKIFHVVSSQIHILILENHLFSYTIIANKISKPATLIAFAQFLTRRQIKQVGF